jgi:RIO kinase 1
MAAPTLNTIRLAPDEAQRLYAEVLRNVDLMLQHDLVHGDLSAYNILYWRSEGQPSEITVIDLPQVINLHTNDRARFVLGRDLQRTCGYFCRQGVACEATALANRFWARYVEEIDPDDLAADLSRMDREHSEALDEAEPQLAHGDD